MLVSPFIVTLREIFNEFGTPCYLGVYFILVVSLTAYFLGPSILLHLVNRINEQFGQGGSLVKGKL